MTSSRCSPASSPRRCTPPDRDDSGMVTAETAAVLPVLALLLAFALWAVAAGGLQVRCSDAAREAARSAARGDAPATTQALALAAAPRGAVVTVTESALQVVVLVSARVSSNGHWLPPMTVSARAVAAREPGSSGGATR